jgi:hypothetical protein
LQSGKFEGRIEVLEKWDAPVSGRERKDWSFARFDFPAVSHQCRPA